jgi:hypothetical protein
MLTESFCSLTFAIGEEGNNNEAVKFYERFEFQPFPDQSRKLFRVG